jgi:hypothetical protein
MVAFIGTPHPLTVLASALAGAALLGAFGAAGSDAPIALQPEPAAIQLSVSGKVVDRLPGSAPVAIRFAEAPAFSDWPMAAAPDDTIVLASASGSDIGGTGQAVPLPVRTASAEPASSRLVRSGAQRKTALVVAALPPRRPAALDLAQPPAAVAGRPEKRLSVTARMIAFVGSLASLARPL